MITNVLAAYFSPTGTTAKVTRAIAEGVARSLQVPCNDFDWTLPKDREWKIEFEETDLLVIGVPTYGGRVPFKIAPYIRDNLFGKGTLALPVATFGGRAYDSVMQELASLLAANGFRIFGGATVPCEHSFEERMQTGRPTDRDLADANLFGVAAGLRAKEPFSDTFAAETFHIDEPLPGFYTHLRTDGEPAKFLDAVPEFSDRCTGCGICAERCPLGSLHLEEGRPVVTDFCFKCMACVKGCPESAITFTNEDFLSHKEMLVETYGDQVCERTFFLADRKESE